MQPERKESATSPRGTPVDKISKYGWRMVDKVGVPYLANKEELHVDTVYQRTMISEGRILQIVQSWSWVACGSLIVAERDGKLWVIDGQHRLVAAMRRSDIKELPCLVFASESAEEEALAFYRANCIRGPVSSFDKLRALLAARDQLALDAITLMEREGYKPSRTDAEHGVRCIAAFITTMKADRGVLQKTWPLIAKLHAGRGIKERIFAALIYIAKFGSDDITTKEWQERILKRGLSAIADSVDRACSLYARGGAKVFAVGALEIINKGVRAGHRITLVEPSVDDQK